MARSLARPLQEVAKAAVAVAEGKLDHRVPVRGPHEMKTLAEACQKTGWQTHAYCLMRNHFHLVIETPDRGEGDGILVPETAAGPSQHIGTTLLIPLAVCQALAAFGLRTTASR